MEYLLFLCYNLKKIYNDQLIYNIKYYKIIFTKCIINKTCYLIKNLKLIYE